MNFTEVVAEILSVIKRPDKLSNIRREVNSAIHIFAQDGDFAKCFEEVAVTINPAAYAQTIAMTAFPRHRKFKYIRRGGTRNYLSPLALASLGKSDCDIRNKYYIAGTNLNISMTTYALTLDAGYFAYPPYLTDAAPEYWLLDQAWPAVFNRATSKILEDIGDPAGASKFEKHAVAAWLGVRDSTHFQE